MGQTYVKITGTQRVGVGILATAAAYAGTGYLGLLLAIPPGYATALWPPSGIALFAVLQAGPPMLVGVFLGSFILNLTLTLSKGTGALPYALFISSIIGSAAMLQAWVGFYLVGKKVPVRLSSDHEILGLLLKSGPVACLVAASISVGSLYLLGRIPESGFPLNWLTWYLGDATGVLVFVPLCLILFTRQIAEKERKKILVALPMLAAFALCVGIYISFSDYEVEKALAEHEDASSRITLSLAETMEAHAIYLHSARALFDSSTFVSEEEFRTFSQHFFTSNTEFQGLSWAPKTTTKKGREITKLDSSGQLIPTDNHRVYYPIQYIEPNERLKRYIGFDSYSLPEKIRVMDESIRKGAALASTPINLAQPDIPPNILVIVLPVFKHGAPTDTPEERKKSVHGFLTGSFHMKGIMQKAVKRSGVKDSNLEWKIEDVTDPHQRPTIFQTANYQSSPKKADLRYEASISTLGRHWKLTSYKRAIQTLSTQGYGAYLVLLFGAIFSAIVGAFSIVVGMREQTMEREIQKTTLELKNSIAKNQESSRLASLGEMAGSIAHEINNPLAIISGKGRNIVKLLEKGEEKEKVLLAAKKINETVKRITLIIDGLRKISRDSSHDAPVRVSTDAIISDTLSFCQERFKNRGVILTTQNENNHEVLCRSIQISQVLLNLLNNAFQAAIHQEEKWVRLETLSQGGRVYFKVTDSGSGVPEPMKNRIFDPFFTTKPVGEGTGLGLSMSLGIIHSHGGMLYLEEGTANTCFVFWLPIAGSEEQRGEPLPKAA